MSESRDKILKTLRRAPGVSESEGYLFCSEYGRTEVRVNLNDESDFDGLITMVTTTGSITLAEAVVALTPPAEPRKPTYQFVALLKGSECRSFGRSVTFRNIDDTSVTIYFDEEYRISMCLFGNLQLANPQTEDEVLATLRVCRVDQAE